MDILNFLVEPLTLPFMLRAFVVTVLAAAVCALLSCWLVLLGWSLMGDAISHAVLPVWCSPIFLVRPSQWVRWLPPSWR